MVVFFIELFSYSFKIHSFIIQVKMDPKYFLSVILPLSLTLWVAVAVQGQTAGPRQFVAFFSQANCVGNSNYTYYNPSGTANSNGTTLASVRINGM
jgi:hypothetical protein